MDFMSIKIKQTTWNLKPFFKSDNDPAMAKERKIVERESYKFINKWRDRTDYLENPTVLKQALDEYEAWQRNYGTDGKEGYYFHLRSAQEQNNSKIKAKINKIHDFSVKIANDMQFFILEIAKIPEKDQKKFLEHEGLKEYNHFLKRLFVEAKHLLSDSEEKILNLKGIVAHGNWVRMIDSFLAKEERKILTEKGSKAKKNFAEIMSLMNSKKKKVRGSAAEALNDILNKHSDAAENEINSIFQNKKIDDEIRKLSRPDSARHISDDIDSNVVDVLIRTVSARFSISKRYYKLKARLMGVKKLEYHERNVEYGKINKKFSYDDSVSLVSSVLNNLDKEFSGIFSNFVSSGQIDVFPKKGKSDGAFCAAHFISQPTYILLNHTDKLHDVLTMAHETGHGINNELMKKRQNALSFGSPLSTAEVASTFMEDFVLEEIAKKINEKERLAIVMAKLGDCVSTIFRQTACYCFEEELHSEIRVQGYLPKEKIGKIFQKHMAAYMGSAVMQSKGSENWWVYWGHIRRFFYVYSYVSGFLISKSLQNSVRKDNEFINKVKEFLSAGSSDSPKNIFMKMGIDISDKDFWNKGIDEVENLLDEAEALAKKLKKI